MMLYLLKTIICSAVLLGFYYACLQKQQMAAFSRFYLLASLVASLLIPLVPVPASVPVVVPTWQYAAEPAPIVVALSPSPTTLRTDASASQSAIASPSLWYVAYGAVALMLLGRILWVLWQIHKAAQSHQVVDYQEAKLVLTESQLTPHSFGRYIFLNKQAYESGEIESEIIAHELTHVRQTHSTDIVLFEVLRAFWWVNPCLILYRRAIQLNHEFLADAAVLRSCADVRSYQLLLISKAALLPSGALTSQFNYSSTKKRILMMTTNTPKAMKWVLSAAVVPLAASMMWILGEATYAQVPPKAPKAPKAPRTAPSPADPASLPHEVVPPDPVAPPPPPPPPPPGRVVTNIPAGPGLSEAEMDTYAKLCEANRGANGYMNFSLISPSERSQLNELFRRMSHQQRSNQTIVFRKINHYEQIPTQTQIEEWKNAQKYGLWIDGRKVSNNALNKHTAGNFKHYSVSKLHKNTVNYGKYYFQVDLQTAEYFKKIKAQADTSEVMVFYMAKLPKR